MSTLGQKPATQHVSFQKQTITGNGGTSYTLQQNVGSELDIAVFINNTRQEPTVAYTASGTTLIMTGVVNSSDDFYVIFLGKAINTTGLPINAVNSNAILDTAVTESKIANTAVTNAKIANSTIDLTSKVTGLLPTARGGTGDALGGGAGVLLKTITPSGVAAVEFVHGSAGLVMDSTYKRYEIHIDTLVPASAGPYIGIFLSQNSGSSYAGNDSYMCVNWRYYTNSSSTGTQAQHNPNFCCFHDAQVSSTASNGGVSGKVVFSGAGTAHRQVFKSDFYTYGHNSYNIFSECVGSLKNSNAVNGVKIAFNSGNIASGTCKILGFK